MTTLPRILKWFTIIALRLGVGLNSEQFTIRMSTCVVHTGSGYTEISHSGARPQACCTSCNCRATPLLDMACMPLAHMTVHGQQ